MKKKVLTTLMTVTMIAITLAGCGGSNAETTTPVADGGDAAAEDEVAEFTPAAYMASLKTFEHRFDANIQFISPECAGYYIVSTFQYYAREILK